MDSLVPLQQHIVSPATFFICEKLQEGVTQTEYTSNEVLFIKQRLKLYPAFNEFCYFPYQSITPILSCDWQAMQRSERSKDLDFSCSNFYDLVHLKHTEALAIVCTEHRIKPDVPTNHKDCSGGRVFCPFHLPDMKKVKHNWKWHSDLRSLYNWRTLTGESTNQQTYSPSKWQASAVASWLTNRHPVDLTWGHTFWRVTVQGDWLSLLNNNGISNLLRKLGNT